MRFRRLKLVRENTFLLYTESEIVDTKGIFLCSCEAFHVPVFKAGVLKSLGHFGNFGMLYRGEVSALSLTRHQCQQLRCLFLRGYYYEIFLESKHTLSL